MLEFERGARILILGYGREGKSSHRFLSLYAPGVTIALADANSELAQQATVLEVRAADAVYFGPDYLDHLIDYDLILRSPGISPSTPQLVSARAAGAKVTSLTGLFFQAAASSRIIGITGTKGKSTTSALIHAILSLSFADVRLVGNIGRPALDHLQGATAETIFVCELSSFQLEGLQRSPEIAVLLDVVPEHLDYHGTFADYFKAKQNIINKQQPSDWRIFRQDSPTWTSLLNLPPARQATFALEPNCAGSSSADSEVFFQADQKAIFVKYKFGPAQKLIALSELKLQGAGNLQNIMAAVATALVFPEVELGKIVAALRQFEPLEHRLEYVGQVQGIEFYNDSLSTIPQAAVNALEALGDKVETVILGGFDRGLEFSVLAAALFARRGQIKNLILFPDTGERIWTELCSLAEQSALNAAEIFNVCRTTSMQVAVDFAFANSTENRICLLSPASSSLNLFRDYHDRGTQFKQQVLQRQDVS